MVEEGEREKKCYHHITAKELKRAIARMSNWKAAGPDHVKGF